MKIISNYKDFYCYLMGIYGQDERIVYERVCATKQKDKWVKSGVYKPDYLIDQEGYHFYLLAICGVLYSVYYFNKKFYFFEKDENVMGYMGSHYYISRLWKSKNPTPNERMIRDLFQQMEKKKSQKMWVGGMDDKEKFAEDLYYMKLHLEKTDINEKENCPILLLDRSSKWNRKETAVAKNVKLSDFGIQQIISPNDMYISISNWLSREKKIVDKRTDIEKLTSKGFDKKTSFRKM